MEHFIAFPNFELQCHLLLIPFGCAIMEREDKKYVAEEVEAQAMQSKEGSPQTSSSISMQSLFVVPPIGRNEAECRDDEKKSQVKQREPQVPEEPKVPEEPQVHEVPKVPEVPKVHEVPQVSEEPQVPKQPQVPEAPDPLERESRVVGRVKENMLKRALKDIERAHEPKRKKTVTFQEPSKTQDAEPTPKMQPPSQVPSRSIPCAAIWKFTSKFSFTVRGYEENPWHSGYIPEEIERKKCQEQEKEKPKTDKEDIKSTHSDSGSQFSPVSSDGYEKYEDLATLLPLTDSDADDDKEIDPSQNH